MDDVQVALGLLRRHLAVANGVGIASDDGDGSLEVVGDVGNELLPSCVQAAALRLAFRQPVGEAVEALPDAADLPGTAAVAHPADAPLGLGDHRVVEPPQGTGGGTDGVYYIKVRIGGWEETATAAELAQGVSRLAFRQEQVGAIVEDWLPRRGAEEATLVTGLSAGTDGDGKPVLEVERRTFPLPPWLKTLETQTVTLPEGGGAIPEGTVFWGKVSVEAVTDGSSSSGGEVTGYRLRQEKWVWQDGGLVEAEGSPVEVGEIVFPEASGGGGSGACVGPVVIEGELLRQYYGAMANGVFVSNGQVAAEIPLYGHAEDHTEGVL